MSNLFNYTISCICTAYVHLEVFARLSLATFPLQLLITPILSSVHLSRQRKLSAIRPVTLFIETKQI